MVFLLFHSSLSWNEAFHLFLVLPQSDAIFGEPRRLEGELKFAASHPLWLELRIPLNFLASQSFDLRPQSNMLPRDTKALF